MMTIKPFLIVLLATMVAGPVLVSAQCTSPYTLSKFQAAIAECKLQAPTSSQAASKQELIDGYCSSWFELLDTDKMAFYQTGALMRSELRYLENWFAHTSFQAAHANVRIISQTCDQVTILQIHDDANVGPGPNKPLLRIYRHLAKTPTDHIWAAIKTDATGDNTTHVDLGPTPAGYFDCDVAINAGTMQIAINGTTLDTRDISYWTFPSYWKAGAYLQDAGEATVYFNELTWAENITQYTLSTNTVGQGTVNLDQAGGTYLENTAVELTATPNAGWQFDGWSGDLTGTQNPDTITMDANKSVTATFSMTPSPAGWSPLTNDDFETGWGNWTGGGSDASLSPDFAIGSQCFSLQDDSSTSVATLTNPLDLTPYTQLRIDFSYVVQSFEGSESFHVEFSNDDGATWTTIKSYVNDVDFVDDGTRYNPSLTLDNTTYNFTSTVKIRFRCESSGNGDDVYIDNVNLSGFAPPPNNQEVVIESLTSPGGPFPGETDLNVIGHGADPDHDSHFNVFEIWRGSDPGSVDQPTPLILEEFFISTSNRGSVIIETDSAMDDALAIDVEISNDLLSWRNITNNRQVIGDSGGIRTLRFFDSIALPDDSNFFIRFSSDPTASP
ncbi:MAG: polysaccharide lyase family 7 protein [Verrucomicrobiaceae bacterium]